MIELTEAQKQLITQLRSNSGLVPIISPHPSIPQIITGFILSRTGVLASDHLPLIRHNQNHPVALNPPHIVLSHRDITNPALLNALIDQSEDPDHPRNSQRLEAYVNHLSYYRRYPDAQWWKTGLDLQDSRRFPHSQLFDTLGFKLADGPFDAAMAYIVCQNILAKFPYWERAQSTPIPNRRLLPPVPALLPNLANSETLIKVTVPVLKSKFDEPDWVEPATFYF